MIEPEQDGYFSHVRVDLVDAIGSVPSRALDVGCGDGSTALLLKQRFPGCRVVGVEPNPGAAAVARSRVDELFPSGVEALPFDALVDAFDTILLGDVLEHLVDPWSVLRSIRRTLAPGGVVVATLPNVRNWRVVRDLVLRGRFRYDDCGIMDRGHLRFFTREGVLRLFVEAGLAVERLDPVIPSRAAVANSLTARLFSEFLAQKFLVRASLRKG